MFAQLTFGQFDNLKKPLRIRNFVDWIAPEKGTRDAIKKQSDEIRSRIKGKAEADALTITYTPYSGSFPTKTGLRRHLRGESDVEGQDIDLPFVVKPDKETEFEPLIQRFKKYAEESYPGTKITATKSLVKMEFTGTKLTYDVVPMFSTGLSEMQVIHRENGEVIKTSIQKHREFIRSRTRQTQQEEGVVCFNNMIRLLKWWSEHKQQALNESLILPSFLINLLAAKALEVTNVNTSYPQTLAKLRRDVDAKGRPSSGVYGGSINLSVESTDDTSIIESMVNQYKPIDGTVTFKKTDEDAKMKELSWEKGYIVQFQEGIDITGTRPMQIDFTVSAEKIKIGNAEHKNEWPQK